MKGYRLPLINLSRTSFWGTGLNSKLSELLEIWQTNGANEQEGFDWSSSRPNWMKAFPSDSQFISELPNSIDRTHVRNMCNSEIYGIREKFLNVMIWGYGDRGYGPYRVTQMLREGNALPALSEVYGLCQSGRPKDAYQYLKNNRIRNLGPSFGSKFMNFCTPREIGAPIFDSLISFWIKAHATEEFSGCPTSSENWNLKTYSTYWQWIKDHSELINCFPDQVELVLFRDAESIFAKSTNWSGK